MSEQPTLFQPPAPTGTLTDRQAFVYDELRTQTIHGEGLDSDEVGALLHERAGKHERGIRCQWCHPDGVGVLKALRKKGLARKPRSGGWRAIFAEEPESASDAPDASYDPSTVEIPF